MTFRLVGAPLIEHFDLILLELESEAGRLRVPLVDNWFEVQLAFHRVPDKIGQKAFFVATECLVGTLRETRCDLQWYFLHKAPGLKLRFRLQGPDFDALNTILTTVLGWRFPWCVGVIVGSVFDQAQLMGAPYRQDVERLLTLAADQHLIAASRDTYCTVNKWAEFLIHLLERLELDTWLVYEALSRLHRLRSVQVSGSDQNHSPLFDPMGMLRNLLPEFSCGFETSVSLLQGLNLLFNIWGVEAAAQSHILSLACSTTRPNLLSPNK